jgi:hypothetical protein
MLSVSPVGELDEHFLDLAVLDSELAVCRNRWTGRSSNPWTFKATENMRAEDCQYVLRSSDLAVNGARLGVPQQLAVSRTELSLRLAFEVDVVHCRVLSRTLVK